ncbi:MAG: APC family permease [Gammaproteobacteria bacterium]|nr:APC family permease [Gammaproteobacteria bacterium]
MSESREGQTTSASLHRALGVRDIVLINIAAVLGVRWLSTAAQMGPSSLVLWVLAVLIFFIPSALTVTELSSRQPGEGGIYLWSKTAFGEFHGFISGWAYWVNNVFYFPSLLLFLAGAFLFIGGQRWLQLGDSIWYNTVFSLVLIWLVIGVNIIGVERGKWIASVGAFAAIAVFIVLAITGTWAWSMHGSATDFTAASLIPDTSNFTTLTFFATMTFAFSGMELAPAMAGEIREPRRTIPRAIVISGIGIAFIYIVGTSLVMVAVPEGQVNVITGIPQAFAAIGERISLPWLGALGGLLLVISSTGGLGAWVTGVARIPYVIGIDRYLPSALGKTHPRYGTPHVSLLTQAVVVSLIILSMAAGATIQEAYILLLDLSIILYLIPFLYMFAALPILRRRADGDNDGVTRVPLGDAGPWVFGGLGFAATMLSIVLAFIPPAGTSNPGLFVLKIAASTFLFLAIGLGFYWRNRQPRLA